MNSNESMNQSNRTWNIQRNPSHIGPITKSQKVRRIIDPSETLHKQYSISLSIPKTMLPLATDDIKNYIAEHDGVSFPKLPQVDHGTTTLDDTHTRTRFAVLIQVHHIIINRDDYSEEERKNCWYTQDEISKSRARHHKTVQRMEAGLKQRTASPYRGLEAWTKQGHEEMIEIITSCVDAVMDEQVFQWRIEEDDWDRMAHCSMKFSAEGTAAALQLAQKDAREAQKAYQAMEEEQEQDTGSVGTCPSSPRSVSMASKIFESRGGAGSAFGYKNQKKKNTKRSKRSDKEKKEPMLPSDQEKKEPMLPSRVQWRHILR
jgi:hypothetical protein